MATIMPDKTNTIVTGLSTGEPIAMLMSAFLSIAYYGVIELNFRIFFKFKRWRGLYFWSLLISTWGIALNCTGYIFKFFQIIKADLLSATLIVIGWTCMVTGQSVVLWSRLHLVLYDDSKLRGILILIITNAIICHLPVSILVYGVNSSNPALFIRPYEVYERIQLTVFAAQEIFISCTYIYCTFRFLGADSTPLTTPRRIVMKQLILVNLLIITMDIIIVCLQYTGFYEVQTSFKAATYSIKLKLEFDILNHLVSVSKLKRHNLSSTQPGTTNNNNSNDDDGYDDGSGTTRFPRRTNDRTALSRAQTAPAYTISTCSSSIKPGGPRCSIARADGESSNRYASRGADVPDKDHAATDVGGDSDGATSQGSQHGARTALTVQFKEAEY
jgi:hypothetical protein